MASQTLRTQVAGTRDSPTSIPIDDKHYFDFPTLKSDRTIIPLRLYADAITSHRHLLRFQNSHLLRENCFILALHYDRRVTFSFRL